MVAQAVLAEEWLCGMLINWLAVQEITSCYGSQFITFLEKDAMDAPKGDSLAYPISLDMTHGERSFIMHTIDNLATEAVREGARIAYLAIFGSPSWEEEMKRLAGMLAIPRSGCDVVALNPGGKQAASSCVCSCCIVPA